MNQLPSAIQNEIWQYVRGDRLFHRQLFGQVMDQFNRIIEQTEFELYSFGMPWQKPNRLKFHSDVTKFRYRTWDVKAFLKYQHETGGLLFVDSPEEFAEKAQQWTEWYDREYPEVINLIRQYPIQHDEVV